VQVGASAGYRPTTSTSGSDSVNLNYNPDGMASYPNGQYVIGTFIATSRVQSFTFQNTYPIDVSAGEINAIDLRNITSVPEPSTYAMMVAGLAFLGFCVRRKGALVK
jgi:hypothetical protein